MPSKNHKRPAAPAKQVSTASTTKAPSQPPAAPSDPPVSSSNGPPGAPPAPTGVNRKKQKRRAKQAARLAAERRLSNDVEPSDLHRPAPNGYNNHMNGSSAWSPLHTPVANGAHSADHDSDLDDPEDDETAEADDYDYTDDERAQYAASPDHDQYSSHSHLPDDAARTGRASKNKKGRKKRASNAHENESSTSLSTPAASIRQHPPPPPPPLSNAALRTAHSMSRDNMSRDRIWNTSTQEERENIKEFWLQLGEDERRSLVRIEKEAVLRKMKEQQKHSCSCTVCGRKRTAIEEELEILYDAYYEELEQYANHNQGTFEDGAPIIPPPRMYASPLHALGRRSHPTHHHHHHHPLSHGKVEEIPDDDEEDLEDEYEDEEEDDDDPYSEDDLEEIPRTTPADFFTFGNSLTVKGMSAIFLPRSHADCSRWHTDRRGRPTQTRRETFH